MTVTTGIGYLFTAAVTYSCISYLRAGELKKDLSVFKDRTLGDWVEVFAGNILSIAALAGCYYLSTLGPAFLSWGWLSLLASKDDPTASMNQIVVGATIPYFGIVFLLLLFVNLPRLAAAEEYTYRLGTKDWLHAIPRSLAFGLMHMVVGVPLWCGLALAIPGLWFTKQYFKGGVERSTMAHAVYNMMLASVFLVAIVIATVAGPTPSPSPRGKGSQTESQSRNTGKSLRKDLTRSEVGEIAWPHLSKS